MYNLKSNHQPAPVNKGYMHIHSKAKAHQLGASLMELMVGITIGLLVVLAAIGSLVYTRVSSTTMVDATRLQQKADAAFRIMNFQTLQAGAIELTQSGLDNAAKFSTAYTGFNPTTTTLATSVVSVHGAADGVNKDILRISYQDNGTVRDCLGQATAVATRNVRVDNEFTYVAASNELRCKGAAAGATAQPIVDGVEDFQVRYGVVTSTGFQFLTAANVTDWTNIQAVSVCLQLRGDAQGNPQPGMAPIASCITGTTVPNDGRLRRVFNRTFSLRNALL
jgi:type IV pilus assembly protein PilW